MKLSHSFPLMILVVLGVCGWVQYITHLKQCNCNRGVTTVEVFAFQSTRLDMRGTLIVQPAEKMCFEIHVDAEAGVKFDPEELVERESTTFRDGSPARVFAMPGDGCVTGYVLDEQVSLEILDPARVVIEGRHIGEGKQQSLQ